MCIFQCVYVKLWYNKHFRRCLLYLLGYRFTVILHNWLVNFILQIKRKMRLLSKRSLALMGAFGGAQKYVSTLSPLGSVFNSIPAPKKTDWGSTSKENKVRACSLI